MAIDLDGLKKRLRDYDPDVPSCNRKVERKTCVRAAAHEGTCSSIREPLGFPGWRATMELVEEVERLRLTVGPDRCGIQIPVEPVGKLRVLYCRSCGWTEDVSDTSIPYDQGIGRLGSLCVSCSKAKITLA